MIKYALLGEKLGHSLSPFIHEQIFKHTKTQGSYDLVEIPQNALAATLTNLGKERYTGLNVTIPYKENIMGFLDHISDEASEIGAVNTIKIKNGILTGYNTDYFGFGEMLKRSAITVTGKKIAVFGAGGAARSVIAYLHSKKPERIYVVSKSDTRFAQLKKSFPFVECMTFDKLGEISPSIAVNATPVGMYPNVGFSVINADEAKNIDAFVDLVYNPAETGFIKIGEKLSKTTVGGLYMLIAQAVKAQEIFREIAISPEVTDMIYEDIISTS